MSDIELRQPLQSEGTDNVNFVCEQSKVNENQVEKQILELPIYGLPQEIQDIIISISKGFQSPREFAVVGTFAVISVVIGKKVTSFDGIYENLPSIWVGIVAPSGCGKSQPIKFLKKKLSEIDSENLKEYNMEMEEYEALPKDEQKVQERPRLHRLLIDDSTPEKRNDYLCYNALLQCTDELKGFFDNINRYSKSGESSQLLSIADNTDFSCDRVSKETLLIQRPFLSIIGGVQTDLLPKCFTENFLDSGLYQRFLIVFHPHKVRRHHGKSNFDGSQLSEKWSCIVASIQNHYTNPIRLAFDEDANELLYDFGNNYVEPLKEKVGENCRRISICDKSMIWLHRISLITAIANKRDCITRADVQYAIDCVKYFIDCSMAVLERIEHSNNTKTHIPLQDIVGKFFENFPQLEQLRGMMNKAIGRGDSYLQNMCWKYKGKRESM